MLRALVLLLAGLILHTPAWAEPLPVVASFSILGDLLRQVGGERVQVTVLVGPDEDAHGFQPKPSDARRIKAARLVVMNGLGFDPWLERLARSAGYGGPLVVASQGVRTLAADTHDDHGDHDHPADPHAWQDLGNTLIYVDNLRRALAAADPAGAPAYAANTQAYATRLQALDREIRQSLARLPAERRRLVTSHDAFGYFARAYGLAFLAPVGLSSQSEATAAGVGALIRQIRQEKVPAVFLENVTDPRLMARIQRETGARPGGTLHSDALAANGPAASYEGMMRENLRVLLEALAPR
ncbi:MAG: zinc ABC transporter substrate-binding protein [Rhodocyclaceae bacterium]|jgi:zinc/manganese transport system substrate-binding protein|nr:zinc ABC transporter substrate-binding protein [Rhodocyclaceae bacterium]